MLTAIRDRASGWIAWAIVILISIPFALWGINAYFEEGVNANVAEFDGEVIAYPIYQRSLYNSRNRIRQNTGNEVDAEMLSGEVLGRQVIDDLVGEYLVQREVGSLGYRVSDRQLAEAIRLEAAFQDEAGNFSKRQYEQSVRMMGYSTNEFEDMQRGNAEVQQLVAGFMESSLPVQTAVDEILSLLLQQRTGEYAIIESGPILEEIEVSEDEIVAEYESDESRYTEPEKIKVLFIELNRNEFAVDFEPSEETITDIYLADRDLFRSEERRDVSHILLDADQANIADDLLARLRDGEDFETLAAEYSSDLASAENGGNIGWISRGASAPEFEASAFSLEVGEISGPVESSFGTHIIRVNEIEAEEILPFEEVRDELTMRAKREHAEAELFEATEELSNIAFEQPDSLQPAANALGLEIKESDWFTSTEGAGIGSLAAVRAAAFGTEVGQGYNSDVIQAEDGRVIVLRIQDRQPSVLLALDEVRDQVVESILAAKGAEYTKQVAEDIIMQIDAGQDWNSVLADNGLETVELPSRIEGGGENSYVAEISRIIYAWNRPTEDSEKDVHGHRELNGGNHVVFRITGVEPGDMSLATDEDRQQVESIVNFRFGPNLFESFRSGLREGVQVNINDELL